jgi:hypothetical protein
MRDKARGEAVGGRNPGGGLVASRAGLGVRIEKKKIREMYTDVLENTYRGNVTLKTPHGERQSDESTVMAGLNDNRMVETGSNSEEPSPGLIVGSKNCPEAATARWAEGATSGGGLGSVG